MDICKQFPDKDKIKEMKGAIDIIMQGNNSPENKFLDLLKIANVVLRTTTQKLHNYISSIFFSQSMLRVKLLEAFGENSIINFEKELEKNIDYRNKILQFKRETQFTSKDHSYERAEHVSGEDSAAIYQDRNQLGGKISAYNDSETVYALKLKIIDEYISNLEQALRPNNQPK